MTKRWLGNKPDSCDVCGKEIQDQFFDCAVPMMIGSIWGILCRICFEFEGCSLGTGKGQKYERSDENQPFLKIEG